MKWTWFAAALLVALLVKGVSSGALTGPQDIPQRALAYERAVEDDGKLRIARPEIASAAVEHRIAGNGGLNDARVVAEAAEPAAETKVSWVKVTGNVVNVRRQPDLASKAFTDYDRGTELQLLRERGDWKLVLDPESKTSGWMHGDYLDAVPAQEVASSGAAG